MTRDRGGAYAQAAARVLPRAIQVADRWHLKENASQAFLAATRAGKPIKEIVRCAGHSRGTVRRVLRGQRGEVFRTRKSSLEAHLPWLDARWVAGVGNGAALWRELRDLGFRGSLLPSEPPAAAGQSRSTSQG